jgi:hypothetical protein
MTDTTHLQVGPAFYEPVTVQVPRDDLLHLCTLAKLAAMELKLVADEEYPGDHPVMVRKRLNEQKWAQQIIDAADALSKSVKA